jgi:DNA topoisomerase-1
MESARIERTTIDLESSDGKTALRASGDVTLFDGYLAVYEEGRDDADDEAVSKLPPVVQGAQARVIASRADQHFTEPPPRYSEASLVKKMEELGIGRPSTYASVLTVLRDREYVRMDKNRFIPEDKGRLVTIFLEEFFLRYVEYDFTADLEEKLDKVSAGDLDWKVLLREFWKEFHPKTEEILGLTTRSVLDTLDEALAPFLYPPKADGSDVRVCPTCGTGRLSMKTSRFGPFVGCSNYPECRYTRPIGQAEEGEQASGDRELGVDPDTGMTVFLKSGRFGAYVQLGDGEKPKRSSLPKGWSAPDMDLEKGLRLLRLPREVGLHPEDNQPITAGIGRFGPFVLHAGTYANLSGADEVFEVGLNRAVTLLAEKRAGGAGRRGEATALKDLGAHPVDGAPVRVLSGRYGPYIKHGATNANVPRGTDPAAVTMEQAVALLAERAAKPPGGGKRKPARAAKAAPKAATAKAPAKKKAVAKKKPAAKKATVEA